MVTKLKYDSRTFVKDLNISPTIGLLPAILDFTPNCLTITIAKCFWPKKIQTTENYRWISDVGRTQKLTYRSIAFVQQTAAKKFTIFSARKEIGIEFDSQFFANCFARTLNEFHWFEPPNERVILFERVTESKLGDIMGPKAIRQYHRMRDVRELFKFNFWTNIAFPKLKPDALSPYIETDIQSYETAEAASLLAIVKLIHKDMATQIADLRDITEVEDTVPVEDMLYAYEYKHAYEMYGKAYADRVFPKRPVEVQAVVSSPVMVEEPQQAEQPVFLQSQVDEEDEDDDADEDVLPMPLSPKKKKKSVARRAFKGIRRLVNVGLGVFKRK